MTQRTRRDNIFDNFSNIDDYIAEKDLQSPDVEGDEEMDGEGEIDSMFEHYRFPVDKGPQLPMFWFRLPCLMAVPFQGSEPETL